MAQGAVRDIARERDMALQRLQVLAAELRAQERALRPTPGRLRAPANERLYRRLLNGERGRDLRA